MTDEVHSLPDAQRLLITARKRDYVDMVRRTLDELKSAGRLRNLDVTSPP